MRRAREAADLGRDLKEANEELATLYARLQELDRLKTNFFANVSHELRTPLTLILAPAERVLADLPADDPHRHELEVILRNARVLLGHVNDLLETSKIEAAKLDLDYSELDLGHLVRLVANNFETLALDRSITFTVRTPDHAVPAQGDPTRLQQVLLNLLSNAFKFTPPDGTIRIELRDSRAATRRSSRWPTAVRASSRNDGARSSSASISSTAARHGRWAAPVSGSTSPASWSTSTAAASGWVTRPRAARSSWWSFPVAAPPGSVVQFAIPVPLEQPTAVLLDGHGVSPRPAAPVAPCRPTAAPGTTRHWCWSSRTTRT